MPPRQNDLGLVRTLCYPEGFAAHGDGGLKVVPGGHLEREVNLNPDPANPWESAETVGNDDAFREHWLDGRRHKITGEPLEIVYLLQPTFLLILSPFRPRDLFAGAGTRTCLPAR